nr:hypothetical protein BaRGS_011706 [Batillaria attramentaria]
MIIRFFTEDLAESVLDTAVRRVVPLLAAQNILADFRALALAEVNQNWENVRRFFLKTAVDHADWDLVKQLADHNLYDDERAWLLTKALQQKKWDVAVQLADLGLQAVEMDRVGGDPLAMTDGGQTLLTLPAVSETRYSV